MKDELVIHIGFPKTGTSALQQFWHLNQQRLEMLGILYPYAGRRLLNAHHHLAFSLYDDDKRGGEFDEGLSWDYYHNELAKEILQSNANRVLLSSEVFSQYIDEHKLLELLRYFRVTTVVCFIRRHDQIINSILSQYIKTEQLSSYELANIESEVNYYNKLIKFANSLNNAPQNNLYVNCYDRETCSGNKIFTHFMGQIFGLSDISAFTLPDKISSNPRLAREALEFKRIANSVLSFKETKALIPSLVHYSIAKQEAGQDNWDGMVISPQYRRDLLASVQTQLDKVKNVFFSGRTEPLFEALDTTEEQDESDFALPSLSTAEAHELSHSLIQISFPALTADEVKLVWNALGYNDVTDTGEIVVLSSSIIASLTSGKLAHPFVKEVLKKIFKIKSDNQENPEAIDVVVALTMLRCTKKKRLILHTGFGKTGTSTLQSVLAENPDQLSFHNFYYPACGRGGTTAHHEIAASARPLNDTGYDTDISAGEYIGKLALEISKRPENSIILSSEIFSGRLTYREISPVLDLFEETTVVCYLRRQDNMTMSSYQQWVKHGTQHIQFDEPLAPLPYYYSRSLKLWSDFVKNKGKVQVRPYERSELTNGDVVDDFLTSVLGIEDVTGFERPAAGSVNDRLGRTCFLFKNEANRFLSPEQAEELASRLINECGSLDEGDSWDGSIASPSARHEWLEEFREGNCWVAQNFLLRQNGDLFRDPLVPLEGNEDWQAPTMTVEEAKLVAEKLGVSSTVLEQSENYQEVVVHSLINLFNLEQL